MLSGGYVALSHCGILGIRVRCLGLMAYTRLGFGIVSTQNGREKTSWFWLKSNKTQSQYQSSPSLRLVLHNIRGHLIRNQVHVCHHFVSLPVEMSGWV